MDGETFIKTLVDEVLAQYLHGQEQICGCERCREKIAALTFDALAKNRYVTDQKNHPSRRVQGVDGQLKIEAIRELSKIAPGFKKTSCH